MIIRCEASPLGDNSCLHRALKGQVRAGIEASNLSHGRSSFTHKGRDHTSPWDPGEGGNVVTGDSGDQIEMDLLTEPSWKLLVCNRFNRTELPWAGSTVDLDTLGEIPTR